MINTIITYFSKYGTPQTGLSPTINIVELTGNTYVVSSGVMTETKDGQYKYDFNATDNVKYSIRCDGGVTIPNGERYKYASLDADVIEDNTAIL